MNHSALVTDFDGTVTQVDFFLLIQQRHMPADAPDFLEEYRQGHRTHFEAMQGYFDYAPDDPIALDGLLRDVQLDPSFGANVRALDEAGWDVIVVSAGSDWYIRRIVERAGAKVTIHANPGQIVPGRGLVTELPRDSRFFSPQVGIDKAAVLRDAQSRYDRVAFAGDGPPDLPPALRTSADLRFARGWLAAALQERGEAFQPFQRWSEIATRLLH